MADFIKGTKGKFAINIEAQGFSMDRDDFEIEVISTRESVKGYSSPKLGQSSGIVIYKEKATASSTAEDSDSSEEKETTGTWYAIFDTANLSVGPLRVVATAYIPDENDNDGIRKEVAVARLGKLINK